MESAGVRRLVVALFAICLVFTLLAADPAPSILGTPILLVYPFSVNGSDVSKEAGSRLAITIATQIANLGGVDVKPAPPGVERQEYSNSARTAGADYYIAGYLTPLGDGVSVVEQLVNTQTGIVVFSNTAQVRTFADAAGQGDILREALLRHQSRNLGAYAAPPPPVNTPTPTPGPGSATQANIGRLFGHKQQRANAPAPSPTTSSSRPQEAAAVARTPAPATSVAPTPVAVAAIKRGSDFGVLAIGGSAETERRVFTSAAIRNDMIARHRHVATSGETREAVCSAPSIDTVLGGNLSTQSHTVLGQRSTTATLELLVSDCAGNVVYRQTFAHDARGGWKNAVDAVVANALAAFLRAPAANRG